MCLLWSKHLTRQMRSLLVINTNRILDMGQRLIKIDKLLSQIKRFLKNTIDSFSDGILIGMAILSHTNLDLMGLQDTYIGATTIL